MAENVEFKARLEHPERALERALGLGARDGGILVQRDTYFQARHGRLKLREIEAAGTELIAYDRADGTETRLSRYRRAPASTDLGDALTQALGRRVVVNKRRRLLLLDNVRIHLDEVEGLGSFLEFEAVLGPEDSAEDGHRSLARLANELGIGSEDRVAVGYADLLEASADTLEASADTLRAAAAEVAQTAYAPYSHFRVGAAIRGESGAIYAGANVENASYSQTQCAEASAIGTMIAAGERRIAAVAVAAESVEVCPPCGGCRQRLSEFAAPETPVYLGPETRTLGELLPLGFTL